jgi:hypothetical protein
MTDLKEFDAYNDIKGALPLETVADTPLLIHDIKIVHGIYGDVAIMDVTVEGDEKHRTIRTSSTVLMPILRAAADRGKYPYSGTFTKTKRAWTLA